jgi:hypothetical protein
MRRLNFKRFSETFEFLSWKRFMFFFNINFDPLSLNLFLKKKVKLYFIKLIVNLMWEHLNIQRIKT